MSRKGIGILVLLAAIVVVVLIATSGGSSDHSSEWTEAQTSQLKSEMAEKLPEFTSEGIDCYVKGVESTVPPSSEGLGDSDKEKLEGIAKKCAETPSNVQGILSQACQEEGLLSTTCLDEVTAPATEGIQEELNEYEEEQGIESYSEGGESYGETENEGLNEMDQGLREEYEREEEETGEPHPYPSE